MTACGGLVSLLLLSRAAWAQSITGHRTKPADAVFHLLPPVTAWLVVFSISQPGTVLAICFQIAFSLLVVEAIWALIAKGQLAQLHEQTALNTESSSERSQSLARQPSPNLFSQRASQLLTRERSEDSSECVTGMLRASFLPGQRTQSLHVAFCPPLDTVPHVVSEQIDGPAVSITVAQAESFGARFDLRLRASAQSNTEVVLEFVARTQPVFDNVA
ncbi:MAG: hypothetical protein IH991_24800 [Planctomycetes bacterium]|nr:hypothetical protein [Planctomycetota bacterium]